MKTRGGAQIVNRPEHYGRFAHSNSTLPGQRRKNKNTANTRSKQANQPSPPTFVIPTTPPDVVAVRILRGGDKNEIPYCSVYGPHRWLRHPMHHFCSNCSSFDDDMKHSHLKHRIKRTSKTYRCTSRHSSWACPTETTEQFLYRRHGKRGNISATKQAKRRKIFENIPEDISEIEDESILTPPEEAVNKDEQIRRLEEINKELKDQNDLLISQNGMLSEHISENEKQNLQLSEENNTLCDELMESLQSVRVQKSKLDKTVQSMKQMNANHVSKTEEIKRKHSNTTRTLNYQIMKRDSLLKDLRSNINKASTGKEVVSLFINNLGRLSRERNRNLTKLSNYVANFMWDTQLLDGLLVEAFLEKAKDHIRQNVFSSANIMRVMDMSGGRISMSSIEVLRKLEMEQGCKKTIMPSSGAMKNVTRVVDKYCDNILPFVEGKTESGAEFAEFKASDVVRLMLKAFSLDDVAKQRKVRINQAIDGAQLTTRTNHCTLGLKMCDKSAIDPLTGNLLYASTDETTIQSRNNCFPLKIVFSRETKEVLEEFRTVISDVRKLTETEHAQSELQCMPIESAMDSDLSATWKLCGKGGATKVKLFPCHMCSIEDTELVRPNALPCLTWCKERHPPGFKCYHKDFLDTATVAKLRSQLVVCKEEFKFATEDVEKICYRSKMNCDEDPRKLVSKDQKKDNTSIFFQYDDEKLTEEQRKQYARDITHDLHLRKLTGTGTLPERIERLRSRLIQENVYKTIYKSIVSSEKGAETAIILMTECVPCILHLENRTGLKILTLILQAGLKNVMKKRNPLYSAITGRNDQIKKFLSDIEFIFNTQIFGTIDRRSNWHVPFNWTDKKFEDITMDNNRCRATMQNCEAVINLCFVKEKRRDTWISIVTKYNVMMKTLRRKDDFDDAQIVEFQYLVDDFYQLYIKTNDRAGVTNYFHMLGSGHISEFLFLYRNLYQHSQQGWESFNSYLKVFFFRRTSRGGGRGEFNRVRQIARWLARRLVWMSGISYNSVVAWDSSNIVSNLENSEGYLEEVGGDEDDMFEDLHCVGDNLL